MKTTWILAVTLFLAACSGGGDGGDGGGGGNGSATVDPRCETLCTIKEPQVAGAFDICSAASATQCKSECSARIAGVSTVCASCLLEKACFNAECDTSDSTDVCVADNMCIVKGREGECTYPINDQTAYEDCLRKVYPRRTVACTAEYRPVIECSQVCGQ